MFIKYSFPIQANTVLNNPKITTNHPQSLQTADFILYIRNKRMPSKDYFTTGCFNDKMVL